MLPRLASSPALPAGLTTAVAATSVLAYVFTWPGWTLQPGVVATLGAMAGVALGATLGVTLARASAPVRATSIAWCGVVLAVLAALIWPVWPDLLPPGGASDLTHHLLLIDVIDRTRHLVDGATSEAAMGEMAHYTPGLHLLVVVAGSLTGVEAYRVAYPLLAVTIALKAGFVFLLAGDALVGARARTALAVAAVGVVLFAPRAYSLDGFLQAGFYAQVAAELFVVAGWWGLAQWRFARSMPWLIFVGLMGAATFLVWPIWIGPLLLPVAMGVLTAPGVSWPDRARLAAIAAAPATAVAALHLSQHAAWLRIAGTSGAVPAFVPGLFGSLLIVLALCGLVLLCLRPGPQVTLWCAAAIVAQALSLWLLARWRGADTPYMAMKMIYLGVYPAAVLSAVALSALANRVRAPSAAVWLVTAAVVAAGGRAATSAGLPPPLVNADLARAGEWARANLPPACVDYIVNDAEQAYWLHLAVMGQPRSSPRTADIDGYTANRAAGLWIDRTALPYAIALRELLPGEVWSDGVVLHETGGAVVVGRAGDCPADPH